MEIKERLLKELKENYFWNEEHKCFISNVLVEMKQDDPRIYPENIFDDCISTSVDFILEWVKGVIDDLGEEEFPVNNLLGKAFKIKSPLDRDDYIIELKKRLLKNGGQSK